MLHTECKRMKGLGADWNRQGSRIGNSVEGKPGVFGMRKREEGRWTFNRRSPLVGGLFALWCPTSTHQSNPFLWCGGGQPVGGGGLPLFSAAALIELIIVPDRTRHG